MKHHKCLLIPPIVHLSKHPSFSLVNHELYAHSCENNSLWYYTYITHSDCFLDLLELHLTVKTFFLNDGVELSLVSMKTYFIAMRLMFSCVRRLSLHRVSRYDYFMLSIHFRNYSTRLLLLLSVAHSVFET